MAKLFANSGDPDQTPRSAASDLGLHCLPVTLLRVSRLQWVKLYYTGYARGLCAFRAFVCFAPVGLWLLLVIVDLPGLFVLPFCRTELPSGYVTVCVAYNQTCMQ